MPSPKKKSKRSRNKGSVSDDDELSPRATRKTSLNASNTDGEFSLSTMEPSEEFTRSVIEFSNSKPSPSGRKRSFKKLSIENSACIPINDDRSELTEDKEEEKIQNQSDIPKDKSMTKPEEENDMSIVQSMTMEQMQEHVSRCLQLSTENKINSKNAFALKLIDCMTIISKSVEQSNFAAVACQLDAGAKIYSHRVDAVHHQVMKLVESCIFAEKRAKKQRTEEDGQDNASNDEDDETPADKVKGKGKKSKKKVIASSSDQICRKLKENDPREKFIKCEALPGGIFNKVKSDPNDLSLTLLKNTPFWMDWQNYKPVKAEGTSEIRPIDIKNKRIGPVLDIEDDSDSITRPKLEDVPHDNVNNDSFEEPMVDFDDDPMSDMIEDEVEMETNDDEVNPEFEMVSVAMSRMQTEKNEVSRLDAMKAVFHRPGESDYHYLKMDNSYYWAGPDYWKRPHGLNAAANLKKIIKKKKEPTALQYTGSAKKVSINKQSISGLPLKRTTTLSDKLLTKWTKKKVTFPQDIHFTPQTLLMLFHVETFSDSILNDPPPIDDEFEELHIGNGDNENGQNGDGPPGIDTDDTDNEGNQPDSQNDDEDDFQPLPDSDPHEEGDVDVGGNNEEGGGNNEEGGGGSNEEEGAIVGCASTSASGFTGPCDVYEGDNLVPMVKTVKFDPIKYTAKPNRVDMGHLKQVLLAIVLQAIKDEENELRNEGVENPHGSVAFRNIIITLFNSSDLHHRTREDLTPAMAFLALLSIASEHAFQLVNDDTGDVVISLRTDGGSNSPITASFSGLYQPESDSDGESK